MKKNQDEYINEMVLRVERYCLQYHEWPKYFKNPSKEQQVESSKLNNWLNSSLYNKGLFKFSHVLDKSGISCQIKLDKLAKEYRKTPKRGMNYVLMVVDEIEKYCIENDRFPMAKEGDKLATRLYYWLLYNKYFDNNFKYSDVLDENGRNIKERLDELEVKYGKTDWIITRLNDIISFTLKYNEFPKYESKPSGERDLLANKYAMWLKRGGLPYASLLNEFYAIYTTNRRASFKEEERVLNIWKAKDSKNISLIIYYYVIEIYKALRLGKEDMVLYFKEALKNKLNDYGIEIDINVFIEMFYKDAQEQQEYYYQEYIRHSIANSELALLYRNLYNYVLYINKDVTEDVINIKNR